MLFPGDRGCVENEYAYIDRAKLATFAHSEYSMARSMVSEFHDLAPYASTDILRQSGAPLSGHTGQPLLYQVLSQTSSTQDSGEHAGLVISSCLGPPGATTFTHLSFASLSLRGNRLP